jgi:cellobiose-specific phosphotransferase system component IIC
MIIFVWLIGLIIVAIVAYKIYVDLLKRSVDIKIKDLELNKEINETYKKIIISHSVLYPVIKIDGFNSLRYTTVVALFETLLEAKEFAEIQNEKYKATDTRFGYGDITPILKNKNK